MNEQQAPESLVVATTDFLRRYPPFDRMRADGLRFVDQRLKLAYYPEGSPVLLPDTGTPKALHIVQRGAVARRETAAGEAALTFGPGDCFSVGALMEKLSTNHVYMAAADTFCYELDAADFDRRLGHLRLFQPDARPPHRARRAARRSSAAGRDRTVCDAEERYTARVVAPTFYDPENDRLKT